MGSNKDLTNMKTTKKMAPSKISSSKDPEPETELNPGRKYIKTRTKREGKSKKQSKKDQKNSESDEKENNESLFSECEPLAQQNDDSEAHVLHQGPRVCALQ